MSSASGSIKILYEDDFLLALDKPAGVPSCGEGSVEEKLGFKLVHRLDNNTSGILIAAKNDVAFEKLRAIWKTPRVIKKYTALVLGKTPESGIIDTPIAHHPRKKKKMMPGGKKSRPAQTHFKTLRHFKNYSLLELQITTGVRHQIRIHLASIGHPIAGDKLYQKAKKHPMDTLDLKRHFLHLSAVELLHHRFHSPLPEDLKALFKRPEFA
ncbi:MAG: pseudouridine synthase [Deltaproteobacteria bacterium]|nr:pseudouridine synthase [Deltaproteobacteria bacterium]MDZ4225144.1 pseudouridine synthase [bacterium]